MPIRTLLAAGVAVGSFASAASAVPHFEVVDVGVPTNGAVVMTGYRGYVVRAVSDAGPITSVDFSNASGVSASIGGGLAQRWTDPTGTRNYTVHSPGLDPARNATPSDLNFDSHYLLNPNEVVADRLFEDATPYVGFIQSDAPIRPNYTPLVSTPTVGYGTALGGRPQGDPLPSFSSLEGRFAILPAFRRDVIDVAYVVTNTRVTGNGIIQTDADPFRVNSFVVEVPEPTAIVATSAAAVTLIEARRTEKGDITNLNQSCPFAAISCWRIISGASLLDRRTPF